MIQLLPHFFMGKYYIRNYLPVNGFIVFYDFFSEQCDNLIITDTVRLHDQMTDFVRLQHTGVEFFLQIIEDGALTGTDPSCNSYNLHLFCLIPVFALVHVNLKLHGQMCGTFHFFFQNL